MVRLLFATTNEGKFLEFAKLLHRYLPGLTIVSPKDIWNPLPPECVENGLTFEENAKYKAGYYHGLLKDTPETIIVAEDSGMEIDALNQEPGVHSRRWNGTTMTDDEIISYCLERMDGKRDRKAAYVSSYFVVMPDGKTFAITEESRGEILTSPNSASTMKGLPFRSLFYVPALRKMFHEVREMPLEQRNNYQLGQEIAAQRIADFVAQ